MFVIMGILYLKCVAYLCGAFMQIVTSVVHMYDY